MKLKILAAIAVCRVRMWAGRVLLRVSHVLHVASLGLVALAAKVRGGK